MHSGGWIRPSTPFGLICDHSVLAFLCFACFFYNSLFPEMVVYDDQPVKNNDKRGFASVQPISAVYQRFHSIVQSISALHHWFLAIVQTISACSIGFKLFLPISASYSGFFSSGQHISACYHGLHLLFQSIGYLVYFSISVIVFISFPSFWNNFKRSPLLKMHFGGRLWTATICGLICNHYVLTFLCPFYDWLLPEMVVQDDHSIKKSAHICWSGVPYDYRKIWGITTYPILVEIGRFPTKYSGKMNFRN
jgi:hypothetical protein